MRNYENAERLRDYFLTHEPRKTKANICTARPDWNACSYGDIYAGSGLKCWKQDGKHWCCYCTEVEI